MRTTIMILIALIGGGCSLAQAQGVFDITPKNDDQCGYTVREKQHCFQRFNCSDGAKYEIAYLWDKSAENNGTKFLAICKTENTKGGVDSCQNTPETEGVKNCRIEAIEKGVIQNHDNSETTAPTSPKQKTESETARTAA